MRASTCFLALMLAVPSFTACGGRVEEDAPAPSLDEHHPRFVGTWMFTERVPRGGFAMAIWELGEDGSLVMKTKEEHSGDADALGGVRRTSDRTTCRLAATWSSAGSERLRFGTTCSDGKSRSITYRFSADSSANSVDPNPTLEDVGGELIGWTAQDGWGFVMRKCASLETCS